jgi:diacylglycerol kinase family enzyme
VRIHFVVNPNAGQFRHKELIAAIRREFARHDIVISEKPPAIAPRAPFPRPDPPGLAAAQNEPDIVVAVGGDGTVNRVVNAVVERNIPVGIIPCGSSNDLARALGIPLDLKQACQTIKDARLTNIDLVSVNGRYFATCGGFGIAGDVAERANIWRHGVGWSSRVARGLGRGIYPLALLRELSGGWRPPVARVTCRDTDCADAWFSLLIGNQSHFGGFSASPQADNQDGLLDICQMRAPGNRLGWLRISLRTYSGRADRCPEVSQHRDREVTILSANPVIFFGDGEVLDRGRFFNVRVHARALWVLSPNGDRTWRWWKNTPGKREKMTRDLLRREQCLLTTIDV